MGYEPPPGTKTEAAIKYVLKKGVGRNKDIAEAVDAHPESIPALLAPAVEAGLLVTCKVDTPGSRPQNEYRPSGGMAPAAWRDLAINPAARPPRPESTATESTDTAPAATPKPTRRTGSDKSPVAPPRSELQPAEAPRTAPIKRREPRAKVPTGKLVTGEPARQLQGSKRPYVRKLQPAAAAHAVPVAVPADGFRCGVMSDGALRLEGDFQIDGSGIALQPAQTRVLVNYLRTLERIGEA